MKELTSFPYKSYLEFSLQSTERKRVSCETDYYLGLWDLSWHLLTIDRNDVCRSKERERERERGGRACAISFQLRIAKRSYSANFSLRQLATSVDAVNCLSSLLVSKERWLSYILHLYSVPVYIHFAKCLTYYQPYFETVFEVFLY